MTGGIDREDQHTIIPDVAQPVRTNVYNNSDPGMEARGLIPASGGTISDGAHMGGGLTDKTPTRAGSSLPPVAWCLQERDAKGADSDTKPGHLIPQGGAFDAVPFDTTQVTSAANYSRPQPGDPCHPLAAGAHAPAVAFQSKASAQQSMNPSAVSPSIDVGKAGGVAVAKVGMTVRRLTPVESERLQGFEDNFTRIAWRGKLPESCPDGPRYRALGNSMAVNVIRWIGRRIEMVEGIGDTTRRATDGV